MRKLDRCLKYFMLLLIPLAGVSCGGGGGGQNGVQAVSAGSGHTVVLDNDGTLWGWGSNSRGQVGTTASGPIMDPVQIAPGGTSWAAVSAGGSFTLAIREDGTLWAWGANEFCRLGTTTNSGPTEYIDTPTQVSPGDTTWEQISAGGYHSLALKNDGSLWAWGYNNAGQAASNNVGSAVCSPAQVAVGETDWSSVSAGLWHSMALKDDGSLWGWGENAFGQLGTAYDVNQYTPVQAMVTDTTWAIIRAGAGNTMAIKEDGSLWGWGSNGNGKLGIMVMDLVTPVTTPTQVVPIATDWKMVAPGYYHTLAVKNDGSLWAWGDNFYGQAGTPYPCASSFNQANPVAASKTNWATVAAGTYHSLALENNGSLWGWGDNRSYQLGINLAGTTSVPVMILP